MKRVTLKELAQLTDSELFGDSDYLITGVAPLETATATDITFFSPTQYHQPQRHLEELKNSQAGAIFISKQPTENLTSTTNFLICPNPSLSFQKASHILFPEACIRSGFEGIHPTAVIHSTAKIGSHVQIGPYVVIDSHCEIGNDSFIGSHTYIGHQSTIGSNCMIHPRVTVRERTVVGHRVIIQPGAVIGSCGFGFTQNSRGEHIKLDQIGNVVIEDDVEIGANTTIDRARFGSTRIRRGSKIDNLVQIAHGVEIGEYNLVVAQAGVAGSAKTGKYVVLAAQSGVNGHVILDDGVMLAAKAGASKSLTRGKYNGAPAMPVAEYNRIQVHLRNIVKYVKDLADLKRKFQI